MRPFTICSGITALLLVTPALAGPTCGTGAGFSLPDGKHTRPVRRVGNALLFTSGLRVNTDGAANSYHPDGRPAGALNTLCNGIAVTPRAGRFAGKRISATKPSSLIGSERCQMILDAFRASKAQDYKIGDADIDWFAIAHDSPLDGHYRPCIQASGAFAGYFVAQTARPADPSKGVCDPAHWISSTAIPYITLPGSNLSSRGVRPGDLALVHRRVGDIDHLLVAVAADTGNPGELGEGSVALHHALGNPDSGRLPDNIGDGVTTIIFPGRVAAFPITADSLEAQREGLLTAVGGEAQLLACLNAH